MAGVGNRYFRINPFRKNTPMIFLKFISTEVDEEGQNIEVWEVAHKCKGYMEEKRAVEQTNSGTVVSDVFNLGRINYDPLFKPTTNMMVYTENELFDITGVTDVRQEHKEVEFRLYRHDRSSGIVRESE